MAVKVAYLLKGYVTVIGGSRIEDESTYKLSVKLGELLVKNNLIVVTGGRGGVMEAVCKGAKNFNGLTMGILPGFDRSEANRYVDVAVVTGLGYARNAVNVLTGDVIVSIGGGFGTLSEISLALTYGKPVIILKGSGGVSDLVADNFEIPGKIYVEDSVEAAVKRILELLDS